MFENTQTLQETFEMRGNAFFKTKNNITAKILYIYFLQWTNSKSRLYQTRRSEYLKIQTSNLSAFAQHKLNSTGKMENPTKSSIANCIWYNQSARWKRPGRIKIMQIRGCNVRCTELFDREPRITFRLYRVTRWCEFPGLRSLFERVTAALERKGH